MKRRIIKGIRISGFLLAALAAVYPLEDGNLVVRGMMILIPLAIMLTVCKLLNKWKAN